MRIHKGALFACTLILGFNVVGQESEESTESEASDDGKYIEQVIVKGDRGDVNAMEMPMTVTGFNEAMVDQLGINNNNDLEALVPGLQMGHRGQGSGKNEDDHIYIRGIGSQRTVNFFSDVAVATYIDGIYTDNQYALEPSNMFDVERIEVARGPQGTTGGRPAIAGAISYYTKKPTDTFDLRFMNEFTDQFTQRYNLAFGGPIGDSNLSYRLTTLYWEGDGAQKNIGTGGDYDAPDQLSYTPQLRYKTDQWDINLRYNYTRDQGAPKTSVELYGRDTTTACLVPGTDANGNSICLAENPFYGAENQSPSVRDCDLDDPNRIICAGEDLRNEIDYNRPGDMDSDASQFSLDASYNIGTEYVLNYRAGRRSHKEDSWNDTDGTSRVGGGINPATGLADPFYAMDGKQGGVFADAATHVVRESWQNSHEISLYSTFSGPFQFVVGATTSEGDDPYAFHSSDWAEPLFNTPQTCTNDMIIGLGWTPPLDMNNDGQVTPDEITAAGGNAHYTCPGALPHYSNTSSNSSTTNNMEGNYFTFYGDVAWQSEGVYFNSEYELNDAWTVFGGVRYDQDSKQHLQNGFRFGATWTGFLTEYWILRDGSVDVAVPGVCDACGYDAKKNADWSGLTWNLGFEYLQREDLMYYARASKGYRAGGFAGFGAAHTAAQEGRFDAIAFDAEELINYEVGVKGLYLDNDLQLSVSLFLNDFDTYWMHGSELIPVEERIQGESPFRGDISGIPGVWIRGFEVEGAFRLTDRTTVRGFYNFLDSHISSFETIYWGWDQSLNLQPITLTDRLGNTYTEEYAFVNLEGNRLPNQPRHKWAGTIVHKPEQNLIAGEVTLLTTLTFTGEKDADYVNLPQYTVPDYTRWDARAIWDSPDNKWSVSLFAKNLLNQIAVQAWFPLESGGSAPRGTLTDERELGIQVLWQGM
ncbi:MAG: TonB-dependent receptor [Gammaproteobacteria bacterium]|nr:TonB-dependent receptor [Gammaproteobacteria bacterium]